ncbi:MAG: Glu/Leu/Phe/Val dehydrogenase dimerization domain-containing protein [Rhodospirillales bacterium]
MNASDMVETASDNVLFSNPSFDGHEAVIFGHDRETGLKAIIAIHNTRLGPALGGCRMWPYAYEREAVQDALRLSRGMTYKSAISGLDLGGGKSVIIGNARTDKTEDLLHAMGRLVDSLGGRYLMAEDVGTSVADMDIISRSTAHVRGLSKGSGNPSPATAFGIFRGIQAACGVVYGSDDLNGRRIAVQGLGNVGHRLCRYLAEAGADLVVADIYADMVTRAVEDFGAAAVKPEDIYAVEADVFAPCALGAILNDRTIPQIAAPIIAGSANNQLAEDRHGRELLERGKVYVPDYVINAGGVIDIALENDPRGEAAIMERVAQIGDTVAAILEEASLLGVPTNEVADRMAEERFLGTA